MSIEIRSTLKNSPIRMVVYGPDGIGKSTFCASAPSPVFIAVESGLDNIDALSVTSPASWGHIIEAVDALSLDDRFGTVVVDSLDWAEQLCWAHVCEQGDEKGKKKNIEAFGYGKGYVAAVNEWRILLNALGTARSNGKNVLLISHAHRKPVKNPSGEDYEQWQLKLNDKAAGLIREWCDVVAYAELDVAVTEQDGRNKGLSTGKRVLRTQPSPGIQAKTRYSLPAKIPLEWSSFALAVKAGSHDALPELEKELAARLVKLGNGDVANGCVSFLDARGRTVASLREAIATVQGYLDEKETK